MNKTERRRLVGVIEVIMRSSVSDEYARYILEHESKETGITILEDVIEDVMETSAWDEKGYYSEDDVRLAIGRVLMSRLGIEV